MKIGTHKLLFESLGSVAAQERNEHMTNIVENSESLLWLMKKMQFNMQAQMLKLAMSGISDEELAEARLQIHTTSDAISEFVSVLTWWNPEEDATVFPYVRKATANLATPEELATAG